MVMLKRKQVILAKVETAAYGTDPTPTAGANAILVINPEVKEVKDVVERGINVSTLTNYPNLKGKENLEITFQVEIKGSGSVALAPRLGALLQACSFAETVNSGTSVSYAPASSSQKSITIYAYVDGRRHILTGARGSVKIISVAGQVGLFEFTFMGIHNDATTTDIVTGIYDSPTPQVCKSCAFTYNSKTTLIPKSVELDIANTIAMRESLNDSTGVAGFEITERKPQLVVDVEDNIQTSYDFRGDQMTNYRQVSWVIGASAGNICTFTVPKFNIENIEYADSEGILISKLTGGASIDSSGDDEVTIVFT